MASAEYRCGFWVWSGWGGGGGGGVLLWCLMGGGGAQPPPQKPPTPTKKAPQNPQNLRDTQKAREGRADIAERAFERSGQRAALYPHALRYPLTLLRGIIPLTMIAPPPAGGGGGGGQGGRGVRGTPPKNWRSNRNANVIIILIF